MTAEKKNKLKKEIITFIALTAAAAIIAFNLNSFVQTGGLIPGGFSGFAVLVQQIGRQFLDIEIPYSVIYAYQFNSCIHRIQIYRKEIHNIFFLRRISFELAYRHFPFGHDNFRLDFDKRIRRNTGKRGHKRLSYTRCQRRRNGLYFHIFFRKERYRRVELYSSFQRDTPDYSRTSVRI